MKSKITFLPTAMYCFDLLEAFYIKTTFLKYKNKVGRASPKHPMHCDAWTPASLHLWTMEAANMISQSCNL
jgi:hypothetical protein